MLAAMAALSGIIEAMDEDGGLHGARTTAGLCAVGCILCALEALFGLAG